MSYLAFLILRFTDITTTYNCLKNNCSSELNPFNAFLINKFGLNLFSVINLSLSLLALFIFYKTRKYFISKATFYGFILLNFLVVILNSFVSLF